MRLGDVCTKIGSGATPRGAKEVYLDQGTALIRSQNVYNDGFVRQGLVYIGDGHAKQLGNVTVEAGDVLLNITGDSVARSCRAPASVLPARVNQHVAIIRTDGDALDPRFLRFCLISPQMQEQMLTFAAAGATRKALTKEMIEDFEVPDIPIKQQRAIADVLSELEEKIARNNRVTSILEQLTKALFRATLVEFAKRDDLMPSEVGRIPLGWDVGTLNDVAEVQREVLSAATASGEEPFLGLDDMPRGSTVLDKWGRRDEVSGDTVRFEPGDILFGKLRPYFKKVGVALVRGSCSTEILVIRPRSSAYYALVLGHVSSQEFIDYCDAISSGTKMPRSEWSSASEYPVAIPPADVAEHLSRQVKSSFEVIRRLVLQNRQLFELRAALLPRLFSGDLTVRRADELEPVA